MFSKFFKKIFLPGSIKFIEHAEMGCKQRIILTKEGSKQRTDFLHEKLELIETVKKKKSMTFEEYDNIIPFVVLGYEAEHSKKRHHHKKK